VHAPGCALVGGALLGGALLGGALLGGALLGGALLGGALLGGALWNCAKNWLTAAEVQVRTPLLAVDPSTGSGVWSPSKAAHWTGYPARHPE
jgi:hypothetical protein